MKTRGFEAVPTQNRKYPEVTIKLPVRADSRSAGYDFSSNETATIAPGQKHLFWTDVCSYMLADEVLEIYVRSSIGIKKILQWLIQLVLLILLIMLMKETMAILVFV